MTACVATQSKQSSNLGLVHRTTEMEDGTTVMEDRTTVMEDRTTVMEDRTTVMEDRTTVMEDRTTAMEDRTTAMEDRTTAMEDMTTAMEDRTTAMEDRTTAVQPTASGIYYECILRISSQYCMQSAVRLAQANPWCDQCNQTIIMSIKSRAYRSYYCKRERRKKPECRIAIFEVYERCFVTRKQNNSVRILL